MGSPHGDDAVGWAVVDELAAGSALPRGVRPARCERPPLALVEALAGADAAVVVDATRSGLAPGTVHEPSADGLREARPLSCHGLGVAHALALARALGRLPPRLAIVGVEAGPLEGDGLSPEAAAGARRAAERVRSLVAGFVRELDGRA